jgi:hypothetical protein
MVGGSDQIIHAAGDHVVDENKSASVVESEVPAVSSSSHMVVAKMVNKTSPSMSNYWKKSMITEVDYSSYHAIGWLGGRLEFYVPSVDIPTVDGSTVVCFESHLIAGLSLPPSKFLVAIMNFLGCELVHLNLNAITALSYFTMLCKCWLGIASDTSLLWYFYSPTRYDKVVYSRIGLSLRHSHRNEYINTTFKSSWRGSSQRWFLVDMHVPPQWANRHLLPPLIDNKRGEQEMTLHVAALVKWVVALHNAGLQACHYAEDFTLRQIHPLGHQDKLVSRLFNKDPPTAWPTSVPAPFCSENSPPLVRASIFIDLFYFHYQ